MPVTQVVRSIASRFLADHQIVRTIDVHRAVRVVNDPETLISHLELIDVDSWVSTRDADIHCAVSVCLNNISGIITSYVQ